MTLLLSLLPAFLRPARHDGAFYDRIIEFAPRWLGPNGSPQFWWVMGAVISFYCVHSLHDERRDRSVLFWKSLPVSDLQTVLSKALVALVIVPAWAVGVEVLFQVARLVFMIVEMTSAGFERHAQVLQSAATYSLLAPSMLHYAAKVTLWALPNVAWLLMISAWARSKPLIWAVGIPAAAWMLAMASDLTLGTHVRVEVISIILRLTTSVAPAPHHKLLDEFVPVKLIDPIHQDMHPLTLALGVVAGMTMLAIAVRLRRRSTES